MPLKTLKNPYRGINAHVHSIAQNPWDGPSIWESFHASHIGYLADALNRQLPPHYVAHPEQSLQIWAEDSEAGNGHLARNRPDVAIYQSGVPGRVAAGPALATLADPTLRV